MDAASGVPRTGIPKGTRTMAVSLVQTTWSEAAVSAWAQPVSSTAGVLPATPGVKLTIAGPVAVQLPT